MTLSSIRDYCTVGAFCLLLAGCSGPPAASAPVAVAAAADLQFALPEIVASFHNQNPHIDVRPVYGSSGNFYSQIRNGAPFDLFLSADLEYPRLLVNEGLALGDTLFTYAAGRLALWVPASSALDVETLHMRALDAPSVKLVAIANPQHAPYGRAAEAALRHFGVYDRLAPKLVLGENIAQTLQFVQSGAADAGIVALSLAEAPGVRGQGRYWEIPLDAYPPIEQAAVLLTRARGSNAAARFRAWLKTDAAKTIFRKYGFYLPEAR
jgi:molybdate transport system substrate-binding protein